MSERPAKRPKAMKRTDSAVLMDGDKEVVVLLDSDDSETSPSTPPVVIDDEDDVFDPFEDSDEYEDLDLLEQEFRAPLAGQAILDGHIQVATALLADDGVGIAQVEHNLHITLAPMDLEQLARDAIGLSYHPIIVTLFFEGYRRTSPLPTVRVVHGELQSSTVRANKRFPIGLQLTQAASKYVLAHWQDRPEDFLARLCELLLNRIRNAGNYCMMCDNELPFPGVKPTVCDDQLCAYQLETLGLGADLGIFDRDPKVADLILTMAAAACLDVARQQRSPLVMPPADDSRPLTPAELADILGKLPPTHELAAGERLSLLKKIDPRAEFYLGWLFATNRAHIVSVPPEKQFDQMKTPHQFKIHTSTRKHAEKFEELRAAHGSFFAFHGSSTSNWHKIVRENLKNASNTPLMASGAAYGQGIYMATNSNTSRSYCHQTPGWQQSAFGTLATFIALVEVANSSRVHRHANGTVVAADESCVMLRYLFVYNLSSRVTGMPSVDAQSLAGARYCNSTTIAYGSSYEEVVSAGNLFTTDNDTYFWDIEELVGMIQGKNGMFINGYTQLPFTPVDVKRILAHSAAAPLRKIEADNAAMRRSIPNSIITHLNKIGSLCRNDASEDFTIAHQAIADLRTYLEDLPKATREALASVPFTVTDSHTGQQFRNTVMHAVELVSSGGECVHRFGDFLKQVM